MSWLEAIWRRVHARLLVLAEGTTPSYNSSGAAHEKPGSKEPPPVDRDVDHLERDWELATTDSERRRVIEAAIRLLKLYQPKPDPRARRGTQEWKEAIGKDPRPKRVVAQMYGVSLDTVARYRRGDYGRRKSPVL